MFSGRRYRGAHLAPTPGRHLAGPGGRRVAALGGLGTLWLAGVVATFVLLLGSGTASGAPVCDTTFTGADDGSTFNNAGNWDNGVPDATKHGCIPLGFDVGVSGTLDVEGVTVDAGASLTLGPTTTDLNITGAEVVNDGTIALIDGSFATSTLDLVPGNATLTNDGTITTAAQSPGDNDSFIIGGTVINNGDLTITADTKTQIGNGGQTFTHNGTITLTNANSQLQDNNAFSFTAAAGSTVTGAGSVTFNNGGTLDLAGGDLDTDGPFSVAGYDLTFNNTGTGTLTATGTFDLTGTIATGQTLQLGPNTTDANVTAAGLTNNGTIDLLDGSFTTTTLDLAANDATLTNDGTITTAAQSPGDNDSFILGGTVINNGDLTITADTKTQIGNGGQTFTHNGTITLTNANSQLQDNNAFDFTAAAGSTVTGAGSVTFNNGGTLDLAGGDLDTDGPFSVAGYDLTFNNTGTGTLTATGTFDLTGTIATGQTLQLGPNTTDANVTAAGLTNNGTIDLLDGSFTTTTLDLAANNATLTNNGTITADAVSANDNDNLILGGTVINNGDLTVDTDTTLIIGGANQTFTHNGTITLTNANSQLQDNNAFDFTAAAGSTVTGDGSVTFNNGGTLDLAGGDLDTDGPFSVAGYDLTFNNTGTGTLTATGTFDLTGTIATGQTLQLGPNTTDANVTAAGLTNNGTIDLLDGSFTTTTLDLAANNATLTNNGTITADAVSANDNDNLILGGTVINNGDLTVDTDTTLIIGGANQTFTHNGTITLTNANSQLQDNNAFDFTAAAGSTVTGDGSVTFNNGGTLDLAGGDLDTDGPFSVAGYDLTFNNTGTGTLTATGTFDLTGTIATGQTLQLGPNTTDANVTAAGLTNNGTIDLLDGSFTTTTLDLAANDATLTNNGTITADAVSANDNDNLILGGTVINNGDLTVDTDTTLIIGGANQTFTHNGTITLTNANSQLQDNNAFDFTTTGTAAGAGSVTFNNGTSFSGTGDFDVALDLPGGTLGPGSSPGILNLGTLTLSGASTTDIELGGTTPGVGGHDQINVSGAAALGGTLNVTLFGGFVPEVCDSFEIITGSPVSGSFSTITLPPAIPGIDLVTIVQPTRVLIVATASGDLISRGPGSVAVSEDGTTDTYDICLGDDPNEPVTVDMVDLAGQVTTAPDPLVFSPGDPLSATITVTAVDDAVDETDPHQTTIGHTISGDPVFAGLPLADVSVDITDDDETPVANDDFDSTDDTTAVIIDVAANDTDADGDLDPLSVSLATLPLDGDADVNVDGTITYTPDPGFDGVADFEYTIADLGGNVSNTAEVAVTVGLSGGGNSIPIANPDTVTTTEDRPVTIDVLANDTDGDGDPLSIDTASARTRNGARITENLDGTLTYIPPPRSRAAAPETSTTTTSRPDDTTTTTRPGPDQTTSTTPGPDQTTTTTTRPGTDQTTSTTSGPDRTTSTTTDAPQPSGATDGAPVRADGGPPSLSVGDPTTAIWRSLLAVASDLVGEAPVRFLTTPAGDGSLGPAFVGVDTFTYTVTDGNGGFAVGLVTVTVGPAVVPPPPATIPTGSPPSPPTTATTAPPVIAPPVALPDPAPPVDEDPDDEQAGPLLPPDAVDPPVEDDPADEVEVEADDQEADEEETSIIRGEPLTLSGAAPGCDDVAAIDGDGSTLAEAPVAGGRFELTVDTVSLRPGVRKVEIRCLDDGATVEVREVSISQPIDNSGPGGAGALVVLVIFAMAGATLLVGTPPGAAALPDHLREQRELD